RGQEGVQFAGARGAKAGVVLGPAREAEQGGEVVVIAAPLGDGRQAATTAEHGDGDQGEDRGQRVDGPAAVPRVGDLGEDFVERTGRRLRTHGATPSPTGYKARWFRSLERVMNWSELLAKKRVVAPNYFVVLMA